MLTPLVIINLTPDSFSDGGKWDNFEVLKSSFKDLFLKGIRHYDIGAESTAPQNRPINYKLEISRLEELFDWYLNSFSQRNACTFSLDTYHLETIHWACEKFFSKVPSPLLVWNDVSGVMDKDSFKILKEFPKLKKVHTFTNVHQREATGLHMNFLRQESPISEQLKENFSQATQFFPRDKIILDPGLGLSKTYEQNWELIRSATTLTKNFEIPWLWGVSRKSFFKKGPPQHQGEWNIAQRELLHCHFLHQLPQDSQPIFIRLHDPHIFWSYLAFL